MSLLLVLKCSGYVMAGQWTMSVLILPRVCSIAHTPSVDVWPKWAAETVSVGPSNRETQYYEEDARQNLMYGVGPIVLQCSFRGTAHRLVINRLSRDDTKAFFRLAFCEAYKVLVNLRIWAGPRTYLNASYYPSTCIPRHAEATFHINANINKILLTQQQYVLSFHPQFLTVFGFVLHCHN